MGNFRCPRTNCKLQSRSYTPLRELGKELQEWRERHPGTFPQNEKHLITPCIAPITDPITRRIFTNVHELPCGHFADFATINELSGFIHICKGCKTPLGSIVPSIKRPDLQEKIDTFIQTNQKWLGFSIKENAAEIEKTAKKIKNDHYKMTEEDPKDHSQLFCAMVATCVLCITVTMSYLSLNNSI
jgi:hypothetical protein